MPTFRHCHQMSHCYLSPCLSPQTLFCKWSSKGRIGWNFDSARSHTSPKCFFSAALSSCGTLWGHPLWGEGNSHHFQDIPAIPLLSVTCALLPKSERGPSLPLLQGEQDHSDDSLPLHFPLVQVCCCPPNLPTSHTLCSLRSLHSGHPSESSGTRSSWSESTWSDERSWSQGSGAGGAVFGRG